MEFEPFPVPDEELYMKLLDLLVQTSEKADRVSLPDQFIEITRRSIKSGTIHPYRKDRCPEDMINVVFYDTNRLHFTPSAFFAICQSMVQSRPVILNALSEAGLLYGAPTNTTTAQTRFSVWNERGHKRPVPGYSFLRGNFEAFGDPLILDEEEM